ncbi:MAG: reverse transcriptase family protein, partial [Candidatus Thiodiazotropha taylori]|nr:reverse transcriptase family protein [Candidatus Thiodiazotropha taylori]
LLLGGVDYFNLISESIDRAHNTNINDIIIVGDFNYNMLSNENNRVKDLMQLYGLKQLIKEATHYTEYSTSLIDLIMVRNPNNILTSGVADPFIPDQIRYHCPTVVLLKFTRPTLRSYKRKIWNYARADFEKFREILREHDLVTQIQHTDIGTGVQQIEEAVFDAASKSIPNKTVTIRPNDHPWITCHIKNLIRKRKRCHKKFKTTANIHYWDKYKILRNTVVNEIRRSKKEYFDKLEDMLNSENPNSKLFWKTSKQLLKIGKISQNVPTLKLNDEFAETDLQKAEMLNKYFASQSYVNDDNKVLPQLTDVLHDPLDLFIITPQNTKDVLDNLDASKSCGPDLMSPRLLKEGSSLLATPYSILFNSSLQQGEFPSQWKDANVTCIHKKDDRSLPSNYRPISLLCQAGKIMERCVHKELYNYINTHNLLTPFQSGFVPGDSTTFQLIHTYHTFCEAVDSGKEVRVVFCDISKAFDRVWHRGLLHKLSQMGCSESILKWFSSYLTDRRQRVVINGQASQWTFVKAGVPQGLILGPLLFL